MAGSPTAGTLPPGTNEFERGLIYTVDPRSNAPLVSDAEYRIVASTRFLRPKDETFTAYEPLYRRARGFVERRKKEFTCASRDAALQGTQPPGGQEAPTPEALTSPYVEQLGGPGNDRDALWFDEFYNDFDVRRDRASSSVLTISYGEYVSSPDAVDFESAIMRAEHRARMYIDLVADEGESLEIAQREWRCLDTGKSAKHFLTHINLVFS